ncbi:hypothetical protein [Albidovulum sp.]|uniref:hypothetical protein n=1 Tax=Albidovulum sp. TaxID=1872424 RepID=UPI0039B88A1F
MMNASAQPALGKYGPIDVFRAGRFRDMTGGEQTYTEAGLRQIAASYDREVHPAPVVIGHPDVDAPAYGWVESLFVQGGVLKATLEETAPAFADMVRAGRYKRVSICLFTPRHPANPKPSGFYLKHVGFLGAASPAVPGLRPVKFSGEPDGAVDLYQDNPAFAGGNELAKLRQLVREGEVEKLIAEGRVLPAFKEEVIAFAASLDGDETVSFAEGQAATRKDWFMSYLARQPKVVSFGMTDLGPDPLDAKAAPPRRAAHKVPDGYTVDRRNDAVLSAARELSRVKGINFADAVDLVLAGEAG